MKQNVKKSQPYFSNLTKINNDSVGGKDMAILTYIRNIFYAARHDKCAYRGEILGVPVVCDGTKTPGQIFSAVQNEHKNMRQSFIQSPYGKWLLDFEAELKNLSDSGVTTAVQATLKTGTMLPLIEWYKHLKQTQIVINDFMHKHGEELLYADSLFDLTPNTKNIALILKENGFPDEKQVYEELRDRGQMPERELAEKFIAAYLRQLPSVHVQRFDSLLQSYQEGLSKEIKPTASVWIKTLVKQPLSEKLTVALESQSVVTTHRTQEHLFPLYGHQPIKEK